MEFKYDKENRLLVMTMTDEIDHHVSEKIRRKADYEIQRYMPKKVIFDLSKVSFMDSSGIGLIIGRYKVTSLFGGILEIENANERVKRILEMSGVLKIIKLKEEDILNEKYV